MNRATKHAVSSSMLGATSVQARAIFAALCAIVLLLAVLPRGAAAEDVGGEVPTEAAVPTEAPSEVVATEAPSEVVADEVATATVVTDKADYEPGETVVITGAGFTAGEEVQLVLTEDPAVGLDPAPWIVLADESGGFVDRTFSPNERHLGVTFTLVATGLTSGRSAQATFTDSRAFAVSMTPKAMPVGTTKTLTLTVTNLSEITTLGHIRITLNTSFFSNYNCAGQPAAPTGWNRTCTTNQLNFAAATAGDALTGQESLNINFLVTSSGNTGTVSWNVAAWRLTNTDVFGVPFPAATTDIHARVGEATLTPGIVGTATQNTFTLTVTNRSSTTMRQVSIERNSSFFQDFTSGSNPGFVCPTAAGWTFSCSDTAKIVATNATGITDGQSMSFSFLQTAKTTTSKTANWIVGAAEMTSGSNSFEILDPVTEVADKRATAQFMPTNPAPMNGGTRASLLLRLTRTTGIRALGSAEVDVPAGFTNVSFSPSSTVTTTQVPTSLSSGVNKWNVTYDAVAHRIVLLAINDTDARLTTNGSWLEVPITVTPPTGAATHVWTTRAWQDHESFAVEEFLLTTQPSVTVSASVTPTKLAFTTSPQTLTAGGTSGTITVERQDAANTPATTGALTVHLSSTSGAGAFRNVADDTTITSVAIPDGQSTASFKYRDTAAGTPTLKAADQPGATDTGLSDATQQQTVNAGAAAAITLEDAANGTGVVVGPQEVTSGSSVTAYLISRDTYGNFVGNPAADTWSLENETGGVVEGDLAPAGDDKSATFTGALVGTAKIHAALSVFTDADSGTLTVVPGAPAAIALEDAADGTGAAVATQNVTSGSSVTAYLVSRDAAGNFVANTAADTWSLVGKTGGVVDGDLATAGDAKSATFTGALVGSAKIRAAKSGFSDADSGTLTVVPGAASALTLESASDGTGSAVATQNVTSGSSVTAHLISRDAAGNFVANTAADTWSLQNKTGGVVDGDLVAAGDAKSATFTGVLVGSATVRAAKSGFSDADSGTLTVVHGAPATLALTGSTGNLGIGATRVVTATVKDAAGNVVTTGAGATPSVTFAKDSGAGTVSGLGASTAAAGVATKTVTGTGLGAITLEATTSSLTSNGLTFTVVPGVTMTTGGAPSPSTVQFSDKVTLSATVSGATPEGSAITGTMVFKIGSITVATGVPVDTTGYAESEVAILSPLLPASTTPYAVTAEFTSTNPLYGDSSDNTQTLTITKEYPGTVTYVGDTYVTTPGTSAVVNLAATVGQPSDGSFANFNTLNTGGSRYVVKFYSGTSLLGTANVTNGLDWATTGAGFAHTTVSLNLSGSPHAIEARLVQTAPYFDFTLNGTDKVVASDGDQVLVIAPASGLTINGGGWVPDTGSTNGKGNYGFTVKFNTKLTNLQGNALFIWRSNDPAAVSLTNPTGAVDIKVKTSSLASLSQVGAAVANMARLTGKANVQVINAASGVQIGGFGGGNSNNFTMTLKDNTPDGYAMQIRRSDGSIYKQIGNPLLGTTPTFVTPGGGQIVVRLR